MCVHEHACVRLGGISWAWKEKTKTKYASLKTGGTWQKHWSASAPSCCFYPRRRREGEELLGRGIPRSLPNSSLPHGSKRGCVAKSWLLGVQMPGAQGDTPVCKRIPHLRSRQPLCQLPVPGAQRLSCSLAISHLIQFSLPELSFKILPKIAIFSHCRSLQVRQLLVPGGCPGQEQQLQPQNEPRLTCGGYGGSQDWVLARDLLSSLP